MWQLQHIPTSIHSLQGTNTCTRCVITKLRMSCYIQTQLSIKAVQAPAAIGESSRGYKGSYKRSSATSVSCSAPSWHPQWLAVSAHTPGYWGLHARGLGAAATAVEDRAAVVRLGWAGSGIQPHKSLYPLGLLPQPSRCPTVTLCRLCSVLFCTNGVHVQHDGATQPILTSPWRCKAAALAAVPCTHTPSPALPSTPLSPLRTPKCSSHSALRKPATCPRGSGPIWVCFCSTC